MSMINNVHLGGREQGLGESTYMMKKGQISLCIYIYTHMLLFMRSQYHCAQSVVTNPNKLLDHYVHVKLGTTMLKNVHVSHLV